MTALRPSRVVIDLAALRHNVRLLRRRIGPSVKLYAVCKGDAYGCGAVAVARVCEEERADAIAVGDPEDAITIRAAGIRLPMLAYGVTDPQLAGEMAKLGVIVTIFDHDGLAAYGSAGSEVDAFLELDCGFGRLGFTPADIDAVAGELLRTPSIRLRGLYTHLAAVDDPVAVAGQMTLFADMAAALQAQGVNPPERMVASSRVIAAYPHLNLNAVNPGRALYGLLEGRYAQDLEVRPVISGIESRIIQVKDLAPGMRMGYGGADPRPGSPIRAAVVPIGFAGGFPRNFTDGYILVHGRRAPIIGMMSMEHTLVDVSDIAGARVGDEVVLLGRQGSAEVTPADLAAMTGLEALEILPRLARGLPRAYADVAPDPSTLASGS